MIAPMCTRTGMTMHTTIIMGIIITTVTTTTTTTTMIITTMITTTTITTIITGMIMTTRLAMGTAAPTTTDKCMITGTRNRPGSLSWRPGSWPRTIYSRTETVPGLPAAKSSL